MPESKRDAAVEPGDAGDELNAAERSRAAADSLPEPLVLGEDDAPSSGSSVVRGGLWSLMARGVPQIQVLAVSIAAARFLGPEGLGRQAFIAFTAVSAVRILTGGLGPALIRFIGEGRGQRREDVVRGLIRWGWRIQLLGAVFGGGALLLPALFGSEPTGAWVLAAVAAALAVMHSVPSSVLVALQRWREASIAGLVTGIVAVPATIAVLALGGGITGMFAVEAAVALGNLAWTAWFARRAMGPAAVAVSPVLERRGEVLGFTGLTTVGVVLELVVWRRSELFILERVASDTQIALYAISFAGLMALVRLAEAIPGVTMSTASAMAGAGEYEGIRSGYGRAMRLLFLGSLPLTATSLALGPEALRLVYGDAYGQAAPILLILLFFLPLIPTVTVSYALLLALGKVRVYLIVLAVAAVVDIGVALILIPPLGAIGAALANSAAQLAGAIPIVVYTARQVGSVTWEAGALVRAALASAGAGGLAWAGLNAIGGPVGLVVAAMVAGVAFAGLAVVLRIIPAGDATWLADLGSRRLGPWFARACRLAAARG